MSKIGKPKRLKRDIIEEMAMELALDQTKVHLRLKIFELAGALEGQIAIVGAQQILKMIDPSVVIQKEPRRDPEPFYDWKPI